MDVNLSETVEFLLELSGPTLVQILEVLTLDQDRASDNRLAEMIRWHIIVIEEIIWERQRKLANELLLSI